LQLDELERPAKALDKSLLPIEVRRPEEYPAAFDKMMQWQANAAAVIENPIFFTNREKIVALAASNNLPTIYNAKEYVKAGGLMSFGASYTDLYRRAATYGKVRALPIIRLSSPLHSSWLSTPLLQRRSASPCLRQCSRAPMR